jgi:hypothetical protein
MPGSGLQFAFNESVSAVTKTKSSDVALGTVRYEALNGEMAQWKYVYNGGNSQINPTNGCAILSGASGAYTCTLSSIASYGMMIGLCVHATITTSSYGWVLKEGAATFEAGDDDSFAAAVGIIPGANGLFAKGTSFQLGGTGTTLYSSKVVGQSIASFASAASGLGWFNF